jgi:hypothetical protein
VRAVHDLIHALLYLGPVLLLWAAVARDHTPGERLIALVRAWQDRRRRSRGGVLRLRRSRLRVATASGRTLAWDLGGRGPPTTD